MESLNENNLKKILEDKQRALFIEQNKSQEKVERPPATKEDLDEIYGFYKKLIHQKARLTDGGRAKIRTRLKTFTVNELVQAMDKFSMSKWWAENCGWRGIVWFFHSDDRIDQFLNLPVYEEKSKFSYDNNRRRLTSHREEDNI